MDRYGYVLNKKQQKETLSRYHKEELELMTIYQLREICRMEKIIQGVINPMDKEELIRIILRFRGADEYFLIRKASPQGLETLERWLKETSLKRVREASLTCVSKLLVYEGLAIGYYDRLTLPYDKRIVGTNALVVGGDGLICTILNVEAKGNETDCLYLRKTSEIPCVESEGKNYSLYCMDRRSSEQLYHIYNECPQHLPEHLTVYRIDLLDFEVRKPIPLTMPLAMDFGTTNTTAGVYLDNLYFEQAGLQNGENGLKENEVNYALFSHTSNNAAGWEESNLLPSVVSVLSVNQLTAKFLFGYDAIRLADSSYIDEGFCIFYDIKRWIGDYEKLEEITDREGHRGLMKRKDILKAYFSYVLEEAANRFKCIIKSVHISCPVKQKSKFHKLFQEILPDYQVEETKMLDEGVAVLYNTISNIAHSGNVQNGKEYKALIIDCGGGTTDLCSCSFRIWDRRVSYQIQIDSSYENGDTDFGGNNLTYRIMQWIKIVLTDRLAGKEIQSTELLDDYDIDVYRYVDEYGAAKLYKKLEERYQAAESCLPTRFREYENRSRYEYYQVKNNFYFLFHMAEAVKKEFYNQIGTLRVGLSSCPLAESAATWIVVDKWKLSVVKEGKLEIIKEFPALYLSIYDIERLLKADIYDIICRFMEGLYETRQVEQYSIIRLTGQSCKIGLFRDALKEFVPGRTIQYKQNKKDLTKDYGLKMSCVNGSLCYLKDIKYGFASVSVQSKEPVLPYQITAYTHNGEEVILIDRFIRDDKSGMISRNRENLTLKLYLKDFEGKDRYQYTCYSSLSDFKECLQEDIEAIYKQHIRQADTDNIIEQEVKFFVWSKPLDWSFCVVPVYRKEGRLFLGKEEEVSYENESWILNFFDGMK